MNFYADRNYIHARVYALHGRLLTLRSYYDMAKNGHFHAVLPALDAANIKNEYSAIKEQLFESQAAGVIQLAEASESARDINILFLRCFELQNLKLVCAAASGLQPRPAVWYDIGSFASMGREAAGGVTGLDGVVEYTADTWMKDILSGRSLQAYGDAELLIDAALFRMILQLSGSIRLVDRPGYIKLVSAFYTMLRIAWSRRLEHVYGMDLGGMEYYTGLIPPIPDQARSVKQSMAGSEKKLLKLCGVNTGAGSGELALAERCMERVVHREVCRVFHADFHSVNTMVCYLALVYRQIRNLFSVADGLRFGLTPEKIMENIICEE